MKKLVIAIDTHKNWDEVHTVDLIKLLAHNLPTDTIVEGISANVLENMSFEDTLKLFKKKETAFKSDKFLMKIIISNLKVMVLVFDRYTEDVKEMVDNLTKQFKERHFEILEDEE